MDDDYGDNGYEDLDEGTDGHCAGKGPAKVQVTILRHERVCREYAYLAAALSEYRENCGKPVPPDQSNRWHLDFRVHYQWCLWQKPDHKLLAGEHDARVQWLKDQKCAAPSNYEQQNYCDTYALKALGQNWLREQCGKPTPPDQANRWKDDFPLHYEWCSQVPRAAGIQEEDLRTDYLNREFCIAAPLPRK